MANLAESWRDPRFGWRHSLTTRTAANAKDAALPTLKVGQRVQHVKFGEGVVTALTGAGIEATISILFDGDQERTFLAALIADKLTLTA